MRVFACDHDLWPSHQETCNNPRPLTHNMRPQAAVAAFIGLEGPGVTLGLNRRAAFGATMDNIPGLGVWAVEGDLPPFRREG
jgi:hypothetical protein